MMLAAPARRALAGGGRTRLEHLTQVKESEIMKLHGMGPNAMKCSATLSRGAACPSVGRSRDAGEYAALGVTEIATMPDRDPVEFVEQLVERVLPKLTDVG